MPRFKPPKTWIQIFSAQLKGVDEAEYRQRLETLERLTNAACEKVIKEGFFAVVSPAGMMDGNVVMFVITDPRTRILDGPEVEEVRPMPGILRPAPRE